MTFVQVLVWISSLRADGGIEWGELLFVSAGQGGPVSWGELEQKNWEQEPKKETNAYLGCLWKPWRNRGAWGVFSARGGVGVGFCRRGEPRGGLGTGDTARNNTPVIIKIEKRTQGQKISKA